MNAPRKATQNGPVTRQKALVLQGGELNNIEALKHGDREKKRQLKIVPNDTHAHNLNDGTIDFNVTTCMSATHPITRYVEHCVGVADVDDKNIFIKAHIIPSDI